MKAWLAREKDGFCATVVFAETRGKARALARCTDACEDKRAKKGHWKLGLYFCSCNKGVKLDSNNQEHYNCCPYFKKKEVK